MVRNRILLVFLGISLWILTSGCVQFIARYDGPYEGKVIDAETRQPIEGVVVLGVWYKETPTVAGAVSSYYDAKETVTDRNGDFKIPGKGIKILTNIAPIDLLIFKAGYEYIGPGTWEGLKTSFTLSKKIKWEGKKPIIPLRKLTMEERKNRHTGKANIVPDEKQKILIEEINKEYIDIGRPPYSEVK